MNANLGARHIAMQAEPPPRAYGYNDLSRLTESQFGGVDALACPAANHHLDAVGSTARSYDPAGNTLQIGGVAKSFVYDDRNRMRQYLESGIVKRNYDYNGRGEQVRRWLAANDDRYSVYGEGGQWLGEYDATGAPLQQIVWLGNLPVGMFAGSGANQKLHYIEADALGTPRVVVDPTRGTLGTAVWRWELTGEAFGNTAPNQDPDGDGTAFVFDMRFPGQRYDSVSGLNYNYFRDYESATGRYVESDPIGVLSKLMANYSPSDVDGVEAAFPMYFGSSNTYAYAAANPVVVIDPLGLFDDFGRGRGGEGQGDHPGGCPLIVDITIAVIPRFYPGLPSMHWKFCQYSCAPPGTCPGPDAVYTRYFVVWNPPFKCPPRAVRGKK